MKRVINGLAYNTATSALIATSNWTDDNEIEHHEELYQTRGGAFFLVDTFKEYDREEREWNERSVFEAYAPADVATWLNDGEIEIHREPAGVEFDPPEAEASDEAVATTVFSLRMPAAIKRDVEVRAAKEGVSMNAYIMRMLEAA